MKKLVYIVLAFCLLFITACGEEAKQIDFDNLESNLLNSNAFSDELTLTDNSIGCYLYGLEETDAESMSYYFSSGATAEELVVFKAKDTDGVKKLQDAIKARIEYQITAFESYVPEEVPKLDGAVILTSGLTVAMYVAADYEAAKEATEKNAR